MIWLQSTMQCAVQSENMSSAKLPWLIITSLCNLQYRISATGWLLFMRCVSFTFIRLLPKWTPTEIFDSFWAKYFSDCDFIICPIKGKLRFLKVCKILKRTWHFQTDWILCVLNCSGCNHVANDTCSCCYFLVAKNVNRSWSLRTKNSSSIPSM